MRRWDPHHCPRCGHTFPQAHEVAWFPPLPPVHSQLHLWDHISGQWFPHCHPHCTASPIREGLDYLIASKYVLSLVLVSFAKEQTILADTWLRGGSGGWECFCRTTTQATHLPCPEPRPQGPPYLKCTLAVPGTTIPATANETATN